MTTVVPLADLFTPKDWFTLLDVSLTAIHLVRPIYESDSSAIVDFAIEYLNPAAQRMTGLAEQPGGTLLGHFPHALADSIFQYYQRVFETSEQLAYETNYQADGLDNYFRFNAQRSGERLVVSFTDTSDQDRSAVEQALRASQAAEQAARATAEIQRQRIYDMLENFPAVVASYRGPEHVFELVSHRFQQDFPTRTIKGLPVRQALPELEGQGYYDILDGVYRTGETFYGTELETWVDLTGTGKLELQYYNVCFQATRDAQGGIDGCLNFAYDVTTEVLARQQVQQLNQELEHRVQQRTKQALALQSDLLAAAQRQAQARETFYQVFEQTPAAICIQRGPAHCYEYANQAYRDFFPGRPLIGQSVAEALPETVDSGVVALLDQVYQTGETHFGNELPLLIAQPDGPPRQMYFTFTYQALHEKGEIVGISTFAYNVAEQVIARQQGEAERERIKRLFMEAPAAICILGGPDLVYELVNPGYQALFPGRKLLGQPILAAMPEIADNPVYTTFRQVYETGYTHEEQALLISLIRPADGVREDRYFQYIQQPRYAVDGRIDGVLVFAFEVSEQVRIRQQVQVLNQELQTTNVELHDTNAQLMRTNVDLDTFVYTASHDLKAPITNIESIVLALRETLPAAVQQEEVAHLLDLLDHTVARFQLTIGQLTDISRLQLAHTGPVEQVVLSAVVENVRLDLVPAIRAVNTQLIIEVDPKLVLSFSPANLRSIVYNLLSNAIKYHAPNRPSLVRVRADQTPLGVILTVQDNGLGMNELQQRQLFGLFQRLHTHVEGTGVGLYISKRLVENAGGTIQVQSQPDVGTTFTVSFSN